MRGGYPGRITQNLLQHMMLRIEKMYCLCHQKNLQFQSYWYQYTISSYIECNIFAQVSESISIYGNKIHLFRNSHTFIVFVIVVKFLSCIILYIIQQGLSVMSYASKVIGILYVFISLLFIQILDVATIHLGIDLLLNLLQQRLLYMPNTIHVLYIGLLLHYYIMCQHYDSRQNFIIFK